MGLAGHGPDLGVDAVSDARRCRVCHSHGLTGRARRRRGASLPGGTAFDLQMVPERVADPADCDRRAGSRRRDHGRIAGAQLGHRSLFLALGVWRPRHCRARVECDVVGLRPRGPADHCRQRRGGGGDAAKDLLPATAAQSDSPRLLVCKFRRPMGVVARAVLARRLPDKGARPVAEFDWPLGCAAGWP